MFNKLGWITLRTNSIIPINTHVIAQWKDADGNFLFPNVDSYNEEGVVPTSDHGSYHRVFDVKPIMDRDGKVTGYEYVLALVK